MIRLSVLDTSPIVQGSTAREALRNTLDLAIRAEELGFHRYWLPVGKTPLYQDKLENPSYPDGYRIEEIGR